MLSLAIPLALTGYACGSSKSDSNGPVGAGGSSGAMPGAGHGGTAAGHAGHGGADVDASVPLDASVAGNAGESAGGTAGESGENGEAGAAGDSPTAPSGPTMLPGSPASPALAAITDLMPVPAADADVIDGTILTKLDVWLEDRATVGQVNAALAGIGARIVAMKAGGHAITVGFERVANEAALSQKRKQIESFPGVALAELALTPTATTLPAAPGNSPDNVGHLFASRFPAAWNASARATKGCEANPVNLIVLDFFGFFLPETFDSEVPGFSEEDPKIRTSG